MKWVLIVAAILHVSFSYAQHAQIDKIPGQPYYKYELTTSEIKSTFYLSEVKTDEVLPLIVYIQGSGSSSLFENHNGKVISTAGHITWVDACQSKYRILIVEKPGVDFLQKERSGYFDQVFSLESWSQRIVKVILYVAKHEHIDTSKILVAGHSEGGIVASRVANLMTDMISHVAILAGEGPSQLYSLYRFAQDGTFFNTLEYNLPSDSLRINYLMDVWYDILSNPTSTEKKFWGFTYLRWSSMLRTSVIDELSNYNGNIFLLQGSADKTVHPESATIAYVALLSIGKKIRLEIIENADHSFNLMDKPDEDGWKHAIELILSWFNT